MEIQLAADSLSWFQKIPAASSLTAPSDEILSRRQSPEQEADRPGLDMVLKANYASSEAIEIFDHLREVAMNGGGVERAAALFQTLRFGRGVSSKRLWPWHRIRKTSTMSAAI
jgi:hypothetical protein